MLELGKLLRGTIALEPHESRLRIFSGLLSCSETQSWSPSARNKSIFILGEDFHA